MSDIRINLIGEFQCLDNEGRALEIGAAKDQGVIAILALSEGYACSRSRIIDLLWSDRSKEQARASVRQSLWSLKKALGNSAEELLQVDRKRIVLNPDLIKTDIEEFHELISSSGNEALKNAVSLCRGDLLEGLVIHDRQWDDWLTLERETLRTKLAEILCSLIVRYTSETNAGHLIDTGRRLIGLDPFREEGHRAMMRGYAENNQRALALKQYDQCRDLLKRELDTDPAPDTLALYLQIKDAPNTNVQSGKQEAPPTMQASGHGSLSLPPIDKPSLTIKPFENIGADPDQEYFADGLTWDIYSALVKIPGLLLIEGESPSHNPKQMTVQELGIKFGARFVLKGGVRRSGEQVRVNAELIEVSTNRKIWGERYDRELHNLFAIQDEITEEIVTSMDVKLVGGDSSRYKRNQIKNPAARESMYKGELVMYGPTKQEILEAQHLYEEVIRLEPTSSLGYAMAAMTYWWGVFRGLSDEPSKDLERAVGLAHESLRMHDISGYPHLVLAHTHLQKGKFEEAMTEATHGVMTRPSCPGANALKASILIYLGRPAEAVNLAEYTVRLMPVNPPMYPAILASAYHGCDRHEDAIAAARVSIELDGSNVEPYLVLAASNVEMSRSEEAREAAKGVLELNPEFSLTEFAKSQPYKDKEILNHWLAQLSSAGFK